MKKDRQISAFVSEDINQRLDMFVQETGITKSRLIEDAIASHLDALDELPASAIIPTRIVLTAQSGKRFFELLDEEPRPTQALIDLMRQST